MRERGPMNKQCGPAPLPLAILLTCGCVGAYSVAYADAKPDAELHVPFPKFAPRPSATTLYCTFGDDIGASRRKRKWRQASVHRS